MVQIIKFTFLVHALLLHLPAEAHTGTLQQANNPVLGSRICFVENRGQWEEHIRYKASIPGGSMFVTGNSLVYNFTEPQPCESSASGSRQIRAHAYRVTFLDAAPQGDYREGDRMSYHHNYFIGPDSTRWKSRVSLFGTVTRQNLYEGIDLILYSTPDGSVKYDLAAAPGADISRVRIGFEGVNPVLSGNGELKIRTSINEIIEKAPVSYQEVNGTKVSVRSRYRLENGELRFEFPGGYDTTKALVIDPELVFATYSGSSGSAKLSYSAAYNRQGNFFAASLAYDDGWPVTFGAYQVTVNQRHSIVLSKFTEDGTSMEYATYYGGSRTGIAYPNTLRINDSGEAVIAGAVTSNSLPIVVPALQQFLHGKADIFLARFSADGSRLLASTYVGGTGLEASLPGSVVHEEDPGPDGVNPCDITFDKEGNIWVSSNTGSSDFPVTANALQRSSGGGHDVILFKINKELNQILYATYLGGTGWDGGIAIEYDAERDLVGTVGYTASTGFPVTPNAYKGTRPGGIDGFALLLGSSDYTLKASTYLGTPEEDIAMRLVFDCNGNMVTSGRTTGNYPVTGSAGHVDTGSAFIDKLAPDLSRSLGSTRTGLKFNKMVTSSLMVDVCGNVFISTITGRWILQNGMPLTADAFMSWPATPFYFAAFRGDFSGLLFSTYLGKTEDHMHPGISRMDPRGIIYQSICTYERGWPVSPNAFAATKQNSSADNINFKFRFDLYENSTTRLTTGGGANSEKIHCVRGCRSAFIHFDREQKGPPLKIRILTGGNAVNGVDYEWIPDTIVIPVNQTSASLEIKPLPVPRTSPPDPKYVVISRLEPCACDRILSSDTVWIYDSLYVKGISPAGTICPGDTIRMEADTDPDLGFSWSPRDQIHNINTLSVTAAPLSSTVFQLTAYQKGAPSTCPPRAIRYPVKVEPFPEFTLRTTDLCLGKDSLDLEIIPAAGRINYIYKWEPADRLRNDYDVRNRFLPSAPGVYEKVITASSPEANCTVTDTFTINVHPPFEFAWLSPEDTTIRYGDSLRLEWMGTSDVSKWHWSHISDTFRKGGDPYIYIRPLIATTYTITAYTLQGCPGSANLNIGIDMTPGLYIPNAFTPNGDGLNDQLRIRNLRFEELAEFRIYNRFGQVVFSTQHPATGWDGNHNGVPCEPGTYYYFARMLLPGGKTMDLKGDISLIR